MPRGGGGRLEQRPREALENGGFSLDLVKLLLDNCDIPVALASILSDIEVTSRQLDISKQRLRESRLLEELVESLDSDFSDNTVVPGDLTVAKVRLLKIKLLHNITMILVTDIKTDLCQAIMDICCRIMKKAVADQSESIRPEEKIACLSLLSTLIVKVQEIVVQRLAEILGYLAVMAGLHDTREGFSLVPTNLPYLHFSRTSNSDGECREVSCPETSESELSDSELVCDTEFRIKRIEALIQKDALMNLGLISKRCSKKEVVAFWFLFLSDNAFSPLSGSLMDLIVHYNKRIRYQALAILTDFLSHSCQFLALAQHTDKTTSYTSLSTALAKSMSLLHNLILTRLKEPLSPTEIVALLKMLTALAENCTYARLEPGILDRVISSCFVVGRGERNPVIQVACLSVFASLCQHCATLPAILNSSRDIFGFMVARAKPDTTSIAPDNNVRYMALQAFAGLTTVDLQIFIKQAPDVKRLIDCSLLDSDPSIVLHAFRFIKNFARGLTSLVETELKNVANEVPRNKNMAVSFWIDFLKPSNFELLDKYPNANIKSAFCDCLAEMGSMLFTELPEAKKILCITYILGQCNVDVNRNDVCSDKLIQDRAALSSSLRTLGIFIMFSTYVTDTAFHIDVADAVLLHLPKNSIEHKKGQQDPNNRAVRVSASWALANLTDTLMQAEQERISIGEQEDFPVKIVKDILQCSIVSAVEPSSAVNTKSNAVRCVGNMLYYLTRDRLESDDEFNTLMTSGTNCLISNIKSGKIMKIRWNACYAASNILRKQGIAGDFSWKRELIECLSDIVVNFQNFKVRINAAVALGRAVNRDTLGDQYITIITSLIESLENTHSTEVFGEWQHQENLVSQLSCSLCSLVSLCVTVHEFNKIANIIGEQWDLVSTSITQSAKRISPEKSSPFLAASQTADKLGKDSNDENVQALRSLLIDCSSNS